MRESRHFGLIGGLGVGATIIYYQQIADACIARGVIPQLTITHAHAPTALAHVQAGRIAGMATYLANFIRQAGAAGATFAAIPAVTPHICRAELKQQISLPLVDMLDVTAAHLRHRKLGRIALFGTKFTIESRLFGALGDIDVVPPRDAEIAEIHRIYLLLATAGNCAPEDVARLRDIADTLCTRDGVEAIVLAGTDLNLIFNEANAGFPAVDCAAAHIAAIVDRMTS